MKSAKQNYYDTIRQRIDRHRITSVNRIKTTFHYLLLVLNKARHADDGYKRMDLERHRLLIKLDPASK